MENKVLASGELGTIGSYELAWQGGVMKFSLSAKVGPVKATTVVEVDSAEALDEIAAAIPGKIDDAILGVAKAALAGK